MEENILKTKYFDAEETIAAYEQYTGKPMRERAAAIVRDAEAYINEAYEAGYRAGQEDAHD